MTLNEAIYWLQHYWNVTYNCGQGERIEVDAPIVDDDVFNFLEQNYDGITFTINYALYIEHPLASRFQIDNINSGFGYIRSSGAAATLVNYTGIGGTGEHISGNPFGYAKDENSTSTAPKCLYTNESCGWIPVGSAWIVNAATSEHPEWENLINGSIKNFDGVGNDWNAHTWGYDEIFSGYTSQDDLLLDNQGDYTITNLKSDLGCKRIVLVPVIHVVFNKTGAPNNIFVYPRATAGLESYLEF